MQGATIESLRYVLGIVFVVLYLPGLLFWFFIHPWARFWRSVGPLPTYIVVASVLAVIAALCFRVRDAALGADLGTHWSLVGLSLLMYAVLAWLGVAYGRMNHLTIAMRLGVPELSRHAHQVLVRDGVYGIIRHPVYAIAITWGAAYVLFVNYAGVYLLFLLACPVFYILTFVEERELIDRFGDEYRRYQREVPRLVPRRP
jgi:protein-S-isoprenylcysteine O-methyltransferase Ste14